MPMVRGVIKFPIWGIYAAWRGAAWGPHRCDITRDLHGTSVAY